MSTTEPRAYGAFAGVQPVLVRRRIREMNLVGVGLLPLAVALAVVVAIPNPSLEVTFAVIVGGLGLLTLAFAPRLEVSVTLLVLYLGCLAGPVKLISAAGSGGSVIQDVLIFAVSLGALVRLLASRSSISLPPLTGWVIAFVALVVMNAFNPNTASFLKVAGGFRQQLQYVPFFFFGYALIRSKDRFRKLFILLGVLALVNGAVATYQSRVGPDSVASWGPGYYELVHGTGGLTGRTYHIEGEAQVRPLALGTDIGFGGGIGVLALSGGMAMIAVGLRRGRWIPVVISLGALLAIASSQQRSDVLGAVVALLAFSALSAAAGHRVARPVIAMLAVLALALPLGVVLVSAEGEGVFSRYASIVPSKVAATSANYKAVSLTQIPNDIVHDPFGFGLASTGSAASFGGKSGVTLEGHGFSGETQYNFETVELGLPGLLLWIALVVEMLVLAVRRLPRFADVELRLYLVGVFAAVAAFAMIGLESPVMGGGVFGPFFWLALGVASYWLTGRTGEAAPAGARPAAIGRPATAGEP